MSYSIYKSDGTPITIPDTAVYQGYNDTVPPHISGVGIQLIGQFTSAASYIGPVAQSVLQLTENFSNGTAPGKPLRGQLWYNKLSNTTGNLYVNTDGLTTWTKILTEGNSVSTVSVVTENGISGTVATPTTTPAITLSLGAITPISVAASGTVTGLNLSGTNTGDQTLNSLLPVQTGNAGKILATDGTNTSWITAATPGGGGTVTSVSGTGNVSGLTLSGTVISSGSLTLGGTLSLTSGQVTSALGFTPYSTANPDGYITSAGIATNVSGTVAIANGGTGQTTANAGLNALLPSQVGNNGKLLYTDGTNTSWMVFTGAGTVSSVSGTHGVTVSNPTTNPAIGLDAITPTSVHSSTFIQADGAIFGSNLSGVNTGDQTITLTGAVTGVSTNTSGNTAIVTTLSPNNRTTISITTPASLTYQQKVEAQNILVGFKGYALLNMQTSVGAWVTIYSSNAAQIADT
jgi:hypothetical protein